MNQDNQPKNHIFIIGNGFDLAFGMKTSYRDFINYLFENNLIRLKSIDKSNLTPNKFLILLLHLQIPFNDLFNYCFNNLDQQKQLVLIKGGAKNPFHDYAIHYFFQENSNFINENNKVKDILKNNNLETAKQYLFESFPTKLPYQNNFLFSEDTEQNFDSTNNYRKEVLKYYYRYFKDANLDLVINNWSDLEELIYLIIDSTVQNGSASDITELNNDIENLAKLFQEYIEDQNNKAIEKLKDQSIIDSLDQIFNNYLNTNDIKTFISFNYTTWFEQYLKKNKINHKFYYAHGKIPENNSDILNQELPYILLGHSYAIGDDEHKIAKYRQAKFASASLFYKSFHLHYNKNMQQEKIYSSQTDLLNEILSKSGSTANPIPGPNINILGHSCGWQDRTFFEQLFKKSHSRYNKNMLIYNKFVFHQYFNDNSPPIPDQEKSVFLFQYYGSSEKFYEYNTFEFLKNDDSHNIIMQMNNAFVQKEK